MPQATFKFDITQVISKSYLIQDIFRIDITQVNFRTDINQAIFITDKTYKRIVPCS